MAPRQPTKCLLSLLLLGSTLLTMSHEVETGPKLPMLSSRTSTTKQPNILFIISDDQDLHMNSLDYMPLLQQYIINEGTMYTQHYCTVSLCCPSRVSLWTGKAAHNTNVTDLSPPYGGYPVFVEYGFNDAWGPIWMQEAGYDTYYVGKLMNSQSVNNYNAPYANGFNGSDFSLDPFTYQYWGSFFQRNHEPFVNESGKYSTDLVHNKSLGFLDEWAQADSGRPFFLVSSPANPHSDVIIGGYWLNSTYYVEESATQSPPVPAPRHADMFNDAFVPRTPSFNPAEPNGVGWISTLPRQNATIIDYNDSWYRNRLRAVQSVDEMVEGLVNKIDALGELDNTYIFYSSDNGYHIGQHRLQPSKQCQYKEDINIPMIVRGPGVAKNATTDIVSTHTDLMPTFLTIAGAPLRSDFDGAPIPILANDVATAEANHTSDEHVQAEMWGIIIPEGKYGQNYYPDQTYKALRLIGKGYNFLYTVWCIDAHELYDEIADPYETNNLYVLDHSTTTVNVCNGNSSTSDSITTSSYSSDFSAYPSVSIAASSNNRTSSPCTVTLEQLLPRLDALEQVLKTCQGQQCRDPWQVLHPEGNVQNLLDALSTQYDEFYATQNKVHFDECLAGYFLDNEVPIGIKPYSLDLQ